MKSLILIADMAALHYLEQFDDHEEANKTKELIKRKIAGDNPSREEWVENANANANADAIANARETVIYIIDLLGEQLENIENIDNKVLSILEKEENELNMSAWHTCDTTHCRAGWEITIHPQGKELEKYFGSWMAGTIVHNKSHDNFVDYFASEDEVMEELRASK